ncbi:MAG: hypothetical protein ACP5P0_04000 [Hydrogenobacter sp.]
MSLLNLVKMLKEEYIQNIQKERMKIKEGLKLRLYMQKLRSSENSRTTENPAKNL